LSRQIILAVLSIGTGTALDDEVRTRQAFSGQARLIWEGGVSCGCFDEPFGRDTSVVAIEVSKGSLVAIHSAIGQLANVTLVIELMVSLEAFASFLASLFSFLLIISSGRVQGAALKWPSDRASHLPSHFAIVAATVSRNPMSNELSTLVVVRTEVINFGSMVI